jgi:Arc/MetJ family transcription regulator
MKTPIDIPDKSLQEVIKRTGAKTKRDAVVTAVEEFNRRRRLEEMAERLHGSCPDFMSQEDLQRMRQYPFPLPTS